jgi:SAM-dependent methyltransferase
MSWKDIPGWTCPRLLELYDELAPSLSDQVFVEVGVAYGRSVAYLLEREWPNGLPRVYAVDIWKDFMGGDQWDITWAKNFGSPRKACEAMLQQHGVEACRTVGLLQSDSPGAAQKFADGSVQAVFIDDEHTYQSVRDGIVAWRRKLKSGGVLCGHDINGHYPGVSTAVVEAFGAGNFETRLNDDGWGGIWKWTKP